MVNSQRVIFPLGDFRGMAFRKKDRGGAGHHKKSSLTHRQKMSESPTNLANRPQNNVFRQFPPSLTQKKIHETREKARPTPGEKSSWKYLARFPRILYSGFLLFAHAEICWSAIFFHQISIKFPSKLKAGIENPHLSKPRAPGPPVEFYLGKYLPVSPRRGKAQVGGERSSCPPSASGATSPTGPAR